MTDAGVGMFAGIYVNADTLNVTSEVTKKTDLRLPEFESVLSNAKKSYIVSADCNSTTTGQSSETIIHSADTTSDEKVENYSLKKETNSSRKTFEKKLASTKENTSEVDEQNASILIQHYQTMLREVVASGFGITPEQLDDALVEQGMTMTDLFDVSKLAQLFQTIQDDITTPDVLVNQEFLETMQSISDLTMETIEELGLSLDEFMDMFMESLEDLVKPIEQSEGNEKSIVMNFVDDSEQMVEIIADEEVKVALSQENVDGTKEEIPRDVEEQMLESTADEKESLFDQEDGNSQFSFMDKESNKKDDIFNISNPVRNMEVPQQFISSEPLVGESIKVVELRNLVSELTEYLQLQTNGNGISSIEMQLNPANLGKILVEVATNNGEVTTRIVTQTEAAKESLEASVVQLRNNLEQQGVKVNAVEVTVQTHEFEQNLQQDGSKEQQQLEGELQKKYQKRNLNLNEMTLDDLQGLMSEEDMVVARMMRDNGNVLNIEA